MHGAQHGQVFQGHLGRAVGADLHAGVRAGQADVGLGDRGHPDEVVGAGEERGERGRERPVAADAEADRGRDQLLFGDEHLEVPLGVGLGELVRVGRVADLAVHGHHVGPGAERGQRVAVGLAGGDLVARRVVGGQRDLAGRWRGRRAPGSSRPGAGPRTAGARSPPSSSMARSAMSGGSGLPCQSSRSSTSEKPRPLIVRARMTGGWSAARSPASASAWSMAATSWPSMANTRAPNASMRRGYASRSQDELGRAALAEPVDVDDRDQVGQLVVRRLVQGLPDRALGQLAVAAQHPHPVGSSSRYLPASATPTRVGQALAERAGGHVDPGQHRGGMALQPGAEPPVAGHQLVVGDHPDRLVHRVQQRRRVPLGEDQVVVGRVARARPSRSAGAGRPARRAGRRRTCSRSGAPIRPRCWTGSSPPAVAGRARPPGRDRRR